MVMRTWCSCTIVALLLLVFVVRSPARATLVAHWQFDEAVPGAVVNEIGADGTNNGATINQPGRVGTAYSFDGSNDKVNTNLKSIVPATGPMSIVGWVNTTAPSSGTGQYLFGNYMSGASGRSAMQILNGELGWFTNSDVRSSNVTVNDGRWHHVGVTRDASNQFDFWVDGTPHSIGSYSTAIASGTYDWLMGGRSADNNRNYTGLLDDVRVYDHALSASEIRALPGDLGMAHWKLDETSPGPVVDSASSYTATNNGATINQPGIYGRAYAFDGVDDKINTNSATVVPTSDPFTILAWIKTGDHTSGGSGGQGYIFSNYFGGELGRSGLSILDGELNWFGTSAGNSGFSAAFSGEFISDNLWHLVGITRDDSNALKLWLDGESLLIDGNFTGPVGGQGRNWLIGGRIADELRNFHGSIDDVRVYQRALDASEIAALVVAIPEPASALVFAGCLAGLLVLPRRRRS